MASSVDPFDMNMADRPVSAQSHADSRRHARIIDSVMASITDFAYAFDRHGRVVYANQAPA